MNVKEKGLVTIALLILGAFLIYNGLTQPYPIRDMNSDGAINWKDYDVNGDGRVDMRDIVKVAAAYGSSVGDEKYNSRVDFNGDGVIDDYDLNAIKSYFGQGQLSLIQLLTYRATQPQGMQALAGIACTILALIVWFRWKTRR